MARYVTTTELRVDDRELKPDDEVQQDWFDPAAWNSLLAKGRIEERPDEAAPIAGSLAGANDDAASLEGPGTADRTVDLGSAEHPSFGPSGPGADLQGGEGEWSGQVENAELRPTTLDPEAARAEAAAQEEQRPGDAVLVHGDGLQPQP